jgi:hypothetical protein
MRILRPIAGIIAVGFLGLAIPGLVVDLHDSWMENTFHILTFGGLSAYAVYFSVTGRFTSRATEQENGTV